MDIQFDINRLEWRRDKRGLPEAILRLKIPSVSAILNLIPDPSWDEFVKSVGKEKAEQILASAGNRGSATHVFVETYLSKYNETKNVSEALKYTQEESPKLLEAENISKEKIEEGRNLFYKFYYSEYSNRYSNIIALEMGIYSPSLFFRGKLDMLYNDKVYGLSLMDFKTSNGKIKKDSVKELKYKFQLAAYSLCIKEMYTHKNAKVNYASILCIDKQNDELQEISLTKEELEEYEEKFKTLAIEFHNINNSAYLITK